jgi:DNA-binding response OmpR family regulator
MASSLRLAEFEVGSMAMHGSPGEGAADRDVLVAGDFRIDFRTWQVTVRDQELDLSEEEFEMLVFLIGHPKSIITPHTRLRTHWDNQVRQADFLRVLAQLRLKLESVEGCPHYIRTEPWVVYRFDPHNRTEIP